MVSVRPLLIVLLGVGNIGRELIKRTLYNPNYRYVALVDTSGAIAKSESFSINDLKAIARLKERGGKLYDLEGRFEYFKSFDEGVDTSEYDVLVDTTDSQTYPFIFDALSRVHVITSNKAPIADVPYTAYKELTSKAKRFGKFLDFGVTVGAGMRVPDLINQLNSDGIERVEGCLSGTMNYLSIRMNEGITLSKSLKEAMNAPRYYTEPDLRTDLGGCDFARKLTIVARLCGKGIELSDVEVENIVPMQLRHVPLEIFLKNFSSLDGKMAKRVDKARARNKALWYNGIADLNHDEYSIGFRERKLEDPMSHTQESDNILKIYPTDWKRPVTITGPGAGLQETVTGMISGLRKIVAS